MWISLREEEEIEVELKGCGTWSISASNEVIVSKLTSVHLPTTTSIAENRFCRRSSSPAAALSSTTVVTGPTCRARVIIRR
jgi:hypothetical protein